MQESRQPTAVAGREYDVRSAPYALARFTVLAHPAQRPAAAAFRDLLTGLHRTDALLLHATAPLCDSLHDSRPGHPDAFHRDVVLPLRRALHNGREPRPALLDRLGDLPSRVPALADWLALRAHRTALLARLTEAAEPALADEREALAALCRAPALGKAVALTSADLLRAVERAGTGAADRRARKEEPAVLRYALRASTKTSPLSWFTAVGWGPLTGPPGRPLPSWGAPHLYDVPLRPVVKANRTLTTALTLALLDAPHRRASVPHRITSTARITDGRAAYSRDRTAFAGGRYLVAEEDEAELPFGGPLRLITEHAATPSDIEELTALLTAALGAERGSGRDAAAAFLDRLGQAGLLVPADPIAPGDPDPLAGIASWLRALGEAPAEDVGLAERIGELARLTDAFADTPAAGRPALLAGLSRHWTEALADAGRPVPAASAPISVLSEDVVAPRPLALDGFLDASDHEALGEVTALAELFDLGHLVRRAVRDRFVARYGPGGHCPHPWEFGAEVADAWEAAGRITDLAPADRDDFPTGAHELAALRAEFKAALGDAEEIALPADLVRTLGGRLPHWAVERPLSYGYFLQRDPDRGRLCVNHVYGGWGRFTSRFLDTLDPQATAEVSRQIRRGLGPGARAAQIRPVGGFNANLHPLLVPDEIGPDRRWASLGEADLDLVHDEATDQVRLRLRGTGELLDVLYPGFLAPVLLPRRIAAHLADQPHGVVDFRPLVPRHTLDAPGGRIARTPRLTHRHVVLRRRRWTLPPAVVAELRADLAAAGPVPAAAAARWRVLLDLPEQLFLHPAAAAPAGGAAEDFLNGLSRPKPQFVDLGNALHLRCLAKWLTRHSAGAVLEEALPAPGGLPGPAHAAELVLEVYRAGRTR
ncbi:lantibiotic dehydratase family protein [Streptomyces sp. NBC_00249]|uniref:lantibiotic dehydratase n=1 Tax=Streptomyces sp. NBC_00249 TaxID=2975690 RepID=UPI0022527F05|nr:lantibiotic dehydratase [Streptomyces sp. NBC_00249]MCX5197396.1 lantibiotic dehydratase family protein [Streptomyces sp. NBC_00249]